MNSPPYAVWSLWFSIGWLGRSVLLLLGGLMVYSVISASVTLVRLKDARARNSEKNPDQRNSVHDLQKRWRHIQQATHTLFYIFGVVLFLILQNVGITIGDGGPGSAAYHILGNFICACAFATNVFFGFLVLQIVHWIVSNRLNTTLE